MPNSKKLCYMKSREYHTVNWVDIAPCKNLDEFQKYKIEENIQNLKTYVA